MVGIFSLLVSILLSLALHSGNAKQPVVVAIIDSVINETLPMYQDGIDEGCNFLSRSGLLPDKDDHGTAVMGIVKTIAPKARIMPLGITHNGSAPPERFVEALSYALDHGAHIINISMNVSEEQLEKVRLRVGAQRFDEALLVISAGNFREEYKISYEWENIIVVGALALHKPCRLTSYSAYGPGVDIAAPAGDVGEGLWTIAFDGSPRRFNGTSAATPVISARAALIKEQRPLLAGRGLKRAILLETASCNGLAVSGGRFISEEQLPAFLTQ